MIVGPLVVSWLAPWGGAIVACATAAFFAHLVAELLDVWLSSSNDDDDSSDE